MKKAFEILINNLKKDEKNLLFGENSKIVVNNLRYSTNSKKFFLDCKVLVKDPELLKEAYPDGLNYLIEKSWSMMGFEQQLDIISSFDVFD